MVIKQKILTNLMVKWFTRFSGGWWLVAPVIANEVLMPQVRDEVFSHYAGQTYDVNLKTGRSFISFSLFYVYKPFGQYGLQV